MWACRCFFSFLPYNKKHCYIIIFSFQTCFLEPPSQMGWKTWSLAQHHFKPFLKWPVPWSVLNSTSWPTLFLLFHVLHYLGLTNVVYVYIFTGFSAQNTVHLKHCRSVSCVFLPTSMLKAYKQAHTCTCIYKAKIISSLIMAVSEANFSKLATVFFFLIKY